MNNSGDGRKGRYVTLRDAIVQNVAQNETCIPAGVELFVDGKQVAGGGDVPYAFSLNPLSPEEHRLAARAIDVGGKSSTAEIVVHVSR